MKKSKIFGEITLLLALSLAVNASAAEVTGTLNSGVSGPASGSVGGTVTGGGSTVGGTLTGGTGSSVSDTVTGGSGGNGGGSSSGGSSSGGGEVLGASTGGSTSGGSTGTGGGEVLGASVTPGFPTTGIGSNTLALILGSGLLLSGIATYALTRKTKNI